MRIAYTRHASNANTHNLQRSPGEVAGLGGPACWFWFISRAMNTTWGSMVSCRTCTCNSMWNTLNVYLNKLFLYGQLVLFRREIFCLRWRLADMKVESNSVWLLVLCWTIQLSGEKTNNFWNWSGTDPKALQPATAKQFAGAIPQSQLMSTKSAVFCHWPIVCVWQQKRKDTAEKLNISFFNFCLIWSVCYCGTWPSTWRQCGWKLERRVLVFLFVVVL